MTKRNHNQTHPVTTFIIVIIAFAVIVAIGREALIKTDNNQQDMLCISAEKSGNTQECK